jgi:uncharacterized protein (DUF2235 family)
MVFYLEGVGTGRGTGSIARKIDQWGGGMFGWGLLQNVEEAYKNLIFNYEVGDEIYIFGFSRGAYTARSLAGLIRSVGILDRDRIHKLPEALKRYQQRGEIGHPDTDDNCEFRWQNSRRVTTGQAEREWRSRHHPDSEGAKARTLKISYLGVWDTVGAMGVPSFLWISQFINKKYTFHDCQLSSSVEAARHAVAIDEKRATFPAALWENLDYLNTKKSDVAAQPYQQLWFPGDHGSVGGGGDIVGLSDNALYWIVEGASKQGLYLKEDFLANARLSSDHRAPLCNITKAKVSFTSVMMSAVKKDRQGPELITEVSDAARQRWAEGQYRPAPLKKVARELSSKS